MNEYNGSIKTNNNKDKLWSSKILYEPLVRLYVKNSHIQDALNLSREIYRLTR